MKKVYIAGVDCSISDAIKYAIEGNGIIVPEEKNGNPSLELINFTKKEAKEIYNAPPLKYKIWTNECDKYLKPGGLLMIYHKYVMPNPNPEKYEVVKRVFIGNRTMHLPRVCIVFRKKVE